ncbi:MAG: hypothetical protein JWO31_4139 [Phycisphaerales bacterium]|nr:hypothetical protein [Phycisphaerales bacterium]
MSGPADSLATGREEGFASDAPSAGTLAYANPATPRSRPLVRIAYRIAVLCGALPLIVGTVALLGFVIFHHIAFAMSGFLTIVAGVPIFLIGLLALIYYYFASTARRVELTDEDWVRVRRKTLIPAALLVANFPVAFLYANAGTYLMSRHRVDVTNASGATVDSFITTVDGKQSEIGPIPAGGTVTFTIVAPDDDAEATADYSLRIGTISRQGTLSELLARDAPEHDHRVNIGPDGAMASP